MKIRKFNKILQNFSINFKKILFINKNIENLNDH